MHNKPWKVRRNATVDKIEHWVIDYFKKNPIISISASLTFIGMMSICAYHSHIEYSPAFDLKSLASIIFSSAYVGLSLFFACSFLIFVPAMLIGAWFIPPEEKDPRAVARRIVIFFFSAGFGFYGLCAFVFLSSFAEDVPANAIWGLIALCLLIYLWRKKVFANLRLAFKQAYADNPPAAWHRRPLKYAWTLACATWTPWSKDSLAVVKMALALTFVCILQIFPLQTYWTFMRNAPGIDDDNINWGSLLYQVWFVGIIIQGIGAYVVASWRHPNMRAAHKLYSAIACLCTPLLISFFGGNGAFLPATIARILKIGNFATVEMTLTPAGCAIVADRNSSPCDNDPAKKNKIYGAYVMSGIGTETYLKIPTSDPKKLKDGVFSRDIRIPSKEIMGLEMDLSKHYYNVKAIEKSFKPKS
jgi:hypothetical protein